MKNLTFEDVIAAHKRISPYITKTPLISCQSLNEELGSEIFFKLESKQKTGSFKVRGALNHLLYLKEVNQLPTKVVAVSSGNHAQGVAWACKMLGIEALIYITKISSPLKIQATRDYDAEVIVTETRLEANQQCAKKAQEGYHLIHPFDDDLVIAGQGTACLEAIGEIEDFDAIFAPCGGAGLTSGTYLAAQKLTNPPKIFAVEPQIANDAAISIQTGKIYKFDDSPNTIADGVRSLSICERTFTYLKKINGIITQSEDQIINWTKKLNTLLQTPIETTSAMTMGGCETWIRENKIVNQKILVIISGSNC